MEAVMAVIIGLLFASGIYMMLTRVLLKVILGTALLSHGTLLLLITVGKLQRGAAPILNGEGPYVDPLPQALILTAIVIGFGVTAFLIVLSFRSYEETGEEDINEFRSIEDDN